MNKILSITLLSLLPLCAQAQAVGKATVKLSDTTLMYEMRATPSPLNGASVSDRAVSFQWPLPQHTAKRSGRDRRESSSKRNRQK